MNFYTPQRGANETQEQYRKRQREQKHYMKRGCNFFTCQPYVRNGRIIFFSYKKEMED